MEQSQDKARDSSSTTTPKTERTRRRPSRTYEVVLAATGEDGIRAFDTEQPDCVLLDTTCVSRAIESVRAGLGERIDRQPQAGGVPVLKGETRPDMRCPHGRARLAEVLPLRACSSLNGTRLLVVIPDTPIHRTSRA
jgi:hypothetical protein